MSGITSHIIEFTVLMLVLAWLIANYQGFGSVAAASKDAVVGSFNALIGR